jgi:coenzyme F420-reducing hydrogenase alpha subunit
MADNSRTIRVNMLTRVEGEGGLTVRVADGKVMGVELNIFEPPRLFEALLRGRALEETPDITARICGICPVAYQMSAVHALEAALGVTISPEIRRLRRLLYCGEWIESHALHIYLLHAPDFFGCASGPELAQRFPTEIRRGLRMKKHGNQILEVLGGRPIHPINVAVGGFYRAPRREELSSLLSDMDWGRDAAIATARWVAGFEFPAVERDFDFVALHHPAEYAMNEGRVASTSGLDIATGDYEQHFAEQQVPHSTALHSVRIGAPGPYFVGPLARVALNYQQLRPVARQIADELGFDKPCRNPFRSIVARAIELVQAFDEAHEIVAAYLPPQPSRHSYQPRVGFGSAATEAPRGLLYHRYGIDADGRLTFAKIVPPTSQNQWQIERDLAELLPSILCWDDSRVAEACERAVRNYDPCISCSTHFLRVRITRLGEQQP